MEKPAAAPLATTAAMKLPVTITLTTPVKHGGEEITQVAFTRAPVAGDLRGVKLTELDLADNLATVIGRLAGLPPSVVQQMSLEDFGACAEVVTGFLPVGRRTGSAPAD